jgi:hypothetical protein
MKDRLIAWSKHARTYIGTKCAAAWKRGNEKLARISLLKLFCGVACALLIFLIGLGFYYRGNSKVAQKPAPRQTATVTVQAQALPEPYPLPDPEKSSPVIAKKTGSCDAKDCTSAITHVGENEAERLSPLEPPKQRSRILRLPTSGDRGQVRSMIVGGCWYENSATIKCPGVVENHTDDEIRLFERGGDGCDDQRNCFEIGANNGDDQFTNGGGIINIPPGGRAGFYLRIKSHVESKHIADLTLRFTWETQRGFGENPFAQYYHNIPVDR